MIALYQFSMSPFTEKVRRALNHKGPDFEVHEVVCAKVAEGEYQHVGPTGKFPAIQEGVTVVWDSTDNVYHLQKARGGPSLTPSDARDAALDEFGQSLPGVRSRSSWPRSCRPSRG